MAVNQQQQQGGDPEITYRDPRAYIAYLRTRRLNAMQIDDLVRRRFGAGETPEQRANREAKEKQTSGLAQAGGVVGGALVTNEALGGFKNVRGLFDSKPDAPASFTAEPVGAAATATSASQAALNAPGEAASSMPQVISTEGAMSTVQTPAGTQQVPTESLNDPSFWSNVNWGEVAQGGLGLAQMYGAYQAFKKGDKVGGGLGMASGAANVAASGLAGAGAQSAVQSGAGAYAIPGLNIAMGAYGAYKTAEMTGEMAAGKQRDVGAAQSGAMAGAAIGSVIPGLGTLAGAAIGALAGYAGSKFAGSSKKKPQVLRDNIRNVLQKNNILDENYQGTLADGSKYDFGKDGSTLKWSNINKIAEAQPAAWNAAVPAADALAASYGFVGQKASDLAAWYAKGAVSNAGNDGNIALQNMQHFAKQQGITLDGVKSKLDEALKDQRITQDKYNYYLNGAQQLLGAAGPGAGTAPAVVQRAEKGKVARQSPGLYRDDQGKLVAGNSMRTALENAYNKKKEDKKDGKGK